MINFAFFGTDELSVGVLSALKERGFLPSLIVTVPDKPQGRKMVMTPSLAKVWAEENGVKYIQPVKLSRFNLDMNSTENPAYQELSGYDLFIVASYGKIIPQAVLDLPKHGTLNVHPSLLPKYRGPAPVEYTILNGDTETGVSIMLLDSKMDHGPILAVEKINLTGEEYFLDLLTHAAKIGGNLLADIMPDFVTGKITPVEQDHSQATFTKKIEKEEGLIDITGDPILNYRKIRAFTPWPGTYFYVAKGDKKIRIVIKKAKLENLPDSKAGSQLIIERVIPEGKKEMAWEDFKRNL